MESDIPTLILPPIKIDTCSALLTGKSYLIFSPEKKKKTKALTSSFPGCCAGKLLESENGRALMLLFCKEGYLLITTEDKEASFSNSLEKYLSLGITEIHFSLTFLLFHNHSLLNSFYLGTLE